MSSKRSPTARKSSPSKLKEEAHHPATSVATADVVIIGGGVIGAGIAFHLTAAGCRDVLILEREERQGLGSTGKATGGARVQFSTRINVEMSRYSIDFFAQAKDTLLCDVGYRPNGYLFLATNEKHLEDLRAAHAVQRAAGVINVEMVTTEDIKRLAPEVCTDDLLGGSFCPTDGFIEPIKIMQGFTSRAEECGARMLFGAEVVKIETDANGVSGVVTTRGTVATRTVINAAGAWAGEVAQAANVYLPVVPLRRQIVAAQIPETSFLKSPMVIDIQNGFHYRPDFATNSESGVLMAMPDTDETPGFKTEFNENFIPKALACATSRAPVFARARVCLNRSRAGLYEITPDHHAIIGESPELRGLYFACGFSGHGVMHSPAVGLILAQLVLENRSRSFDITPLAPERFSDGRRHDRETTFL